MTTIPPFQDAQKLPPCAVGCNNLYAANAPCVPPQAPQAAASVYTACFCSQGVLAPLATGTADVCGGACDATGMQSVASWFRGICNIGNSGNGGNSGNAEDDTNGGNGNAGNNPAESSTSTDGSGATGVANTSDGSGGGGDWLSNHWKWVVMIVVVVVAIVGIWIGACIWRRRYLKKKDRQTSLGQKQSGSASRPSWGPPVTGSGSGNIAAPPAVYGEHSSDRGSKRGSRTVFNAAPTSSVFEEEKPKEKKKWMVRERT